MTVHSVISAVLQQYVHVQHMYIEVNIGCKISWQVLSCQRGSCIFEFSLLDFVKKYSSYWNILILKVSSVHVHDLCKLFYLS